MAGFWSNKVAKEVRPAFDFLIDHGYRLVEEEVSSSFDSGMLIYESDHLRVEVVGDRGHVWFNVRPSSDDRSVDQEILGLLLADAKHWTVPKPVQDDEIAWSAGFLRANLFAIEQLFAPDVRSRTASRARALQQERVDHFVRGRSRG